VAGLSRRTVDNLDQGWRTAAPAESSVIPSPMIVQRSVRRVPESVIGTEFVLYVEDDDDLRELVVELVTVVLKRRCIGVGSYEELVALGEDALRCSVAILDINLGPNRRSGIDAYTWLREKGCTGRIVFLTGHASTHPLVVAANRIGDAEILSKPIDPDQLRAIVEGESQ
jgi:FixJ family two-component response regulator